jgi:hypothetical protein
MTKLIVNFCSLRTRLKNYVVSLLTINLQAEGTEFESLLTPVLVGVLVSLTPCPL